jgi:hypothetical protein
MEIKASWMMNPPSSGTFVTSSAVYTPEGGAPVTTPVGLTGLHIISKVQPTWFWATFEQVDNVANTGAAEKLPISADVAAANTRYQAMLQGTPLAGYELMGIQTATTAYNTPTLLANTQMETYFQESSSCMTCHELSAIGPSSSPRLDMFTMQGGNFQGYTGVLPADTFGSGANAYAKLDYVWSLRNAQ